jgi:hypothetical protein
MRGAHRQPVPFVVKRLRFHRIGRLDATGLSAKRPSAQISKPVAALAPEMGTVLVWHVLSSVARALVSYSFMVGKLAQNALIPARAARQLPDQSTTLRVDSS